MRSAPLTASLSLLFAAASSQGCAPRALLPLASTAGIPITVLTEPEVPLEVVTRGSSVPDPWPVLGTRLSFVDAEPMLRHAVASASTSWAARKQARAQSPSPSLSPPAWQLAVDLVQEEARWRSGRLMVTLSARATLRTRPDHQYLAQTNVSCHEAGLLPPERGTEVVYACMTELSRELAGWLDAVSP